jgi:hypothetical protein
MYPLLSAVTMPTYGKKYKIWSVMIYMINHSEAIILQHYKFNKLKK